MAKKILFQGVPQPSVLSENINAVYPNDIARQETGVVVAGANITVGYDPVTGTFTSAGLYNNSTTPAKGEVQRTPVVFKSNVASNVGATALWTPAVNKRFRILGIYFYVSAATTSAAAPIVTLVDNVTNFMQLITLGATNGVITQQIPLPGNGYLSTTAGNVLSINLSAACTAGGVCVDVWGTEE